MRCKVSSSKFDKHILSSNSPLALFASSELNVAEFRMVLSTSEFHHILLKSVGICSVQTHTQQQQPNNT